MAHPKDCTVVTRRASVLLFLGLVSGTACTRPAPTNSPPRPTSPAVQSDSQTKPKPSQFSHTMAITLMKFSLDDCFTGLYAIDRAMDGLTARTRRDHWESTKQRHDALKVTYRQTCRQWEEIQREGVPAGDRRSIEARLRDLKKALEATDRKREDCERVYVRARQEYEAKKKQVFGAYRDELRRGEATRGRFFADASRAVGLSAVDMLPQHVLVTVETYARPQAAQSGRVEGEGSESPQGLLSVDGLEKKIRLLDQKGVDFGPPVDIEYDRLTTVNGLIVTLAYERSSDVERVPEKLLIERSTFDNAAPILLTLALNDVDAHALNRLKTAEFHDMHQPNTSGRSDWQSTVIPCQRVGMHLRVPVILDIHGVTVKTAMILDTGASVTVLPKALYNRGLAKPLDGLPRIRLRTASGMMTCPVDRLQISTSTYTNKISVALTTDSVSLLGANYFAGRRITMDLENECIHIHP